MLCIAGACERSHLVCKLCALLMIVCLLATCFRTPPVRGSLTARGNQLPTEEYETHYDVRCGNPRQVRPRFISDKIQRPLRAHCLLEDSPRYRRLPQPLFRSCLIGSGIRLRC